MDLAANMAELIVNLLFAVVSSLMSRCRKQRIDQHRGCHSLALDHQETPSSHIQLTGAKAFRVERSQLHDAVYRENTWYEFVAQ